MDKVDLGEIRDEERICCNGRKGCKKKRCCPCIVITILIADCLCIISIFIVFGSTILAGLEKEKIDYDEGQRYLLWITRIWISISMFVVLFCVKAYCGFVWLLSGLTRKAFLPYYQISMTFYGCQIAVSFILVEMAISE